MVELPPSVIVGEFVLLIALPERPEKPFEVMAVLKVPLIFAAPLAPPHVIEVVPASNVEPALTVNTPDAAFARARLLVLNKLPEFTSPTVMLPVTLAVVIAALNVAPLALVLFIERLL